MLPPITYVAFALAAGALVFISREARRLRMPVRLALSIAAGVLWWLLLIILCVSWGADMLDGETP